MLRKLMRLRNFGMLKLRKLSMLKLLMLRLLRLYRINTVVHSGDQGGPCKASFAELIPHQTEKQ